MTTASILETRLLSGLVAPIDQIAGFEGAENDHTRRHGEGQDEYDDAQSGALSGVMPGPQEACRPSREGKGHGKRQSDALRGEIVGHQGRFPHRAQTGLPGKWRYRSVFLDRRGLSESGRSGRPASAPSLIPPLF